METPEKKTPEEQQAVNASKKNKKKSFYQQLREMPYSTDKIGQTFIITTSGKGFAR